MERLRILPFGGLGEIGMNCLALEWADEMVLIDCGIQFPDITYPGVDLLLPDFAYVRERFHTLRGIVVTHGHDDHIGGIPYLAHEGELNVYSTPFPRGLIEHKLDEFPGINEVIFHGIQPGKKFKVGPFTFEPIAVQHSIIESVALAIDTPVGRVIHTGDFKHDANEIGGKVIGFERFKELGDEGVHLLLSDSTNAERTGHTLSETDITKSFDEIFAQQTGRIFIALFASNIRRVENFLRMAHERGKKVAFAGRSMHSYTRLAHEQSSLNIPPDTLVLLENIQKYPDNQVVILLTGSQAEPQSALVRISQGLHKDVQIRNGDKIILSSRFIPGNERNITGMIDHLYRLGAEVVYESIHQIHVSGHGFQDELMMMLHAVRPKYFVPVHGEFRHLAKHAKLAAKEVVAKENVFVIEDGQSLEIDQKGAKLGMSLPLEKTLIVGGNFMHGSAEIFSQRTNLSRTGVVFGVLLRDKRTGRLCKAPSLRSHGLLLREGENEGAVLEEAVEFLEDAYPDLSRHDDITEAVRIELRRFFRKRASHKPLVIPIILDI